MDLLTQLKDDYTRFPHHQTYTLYAPDVVFQDPVNSFQGRERYAKLITWMSVWFQDIRLALHEIYQEGSIIQTQWTLSWTVPLPWHPRLRVDGWTELILNQEGLIQSHRDYWKCSRQDVIKQVFCKRS